MLAIHDNEILKTIDCSLLHGISVMIQILIVLQGEHLVSMNFHYLFTFNWYIGKCVCVTL